MGRIAKILSFTRRVVNGIFFSDVKMNPDGGSNITGEHFADSGNDSPPLPDDTAVTVGIQRNGGQVPVGYIDTKNAGVAVPGEARIYGRDNAGIKINEIYLKADGSILIANFFSGSEIELKADGAVLITNGFGSFELKLDGTIDMNGATVTLLGDVITALGRSLDTHVHPGVTTGPSNTGPPV